MRKIEDENDCKNRRCWTRIQNSKPEKLHSKKLTDAESERQSESGLARGVLYQRQHAIRDADCIVPETESPPSPHQQNDLPNTNVRDPGLGGGQGKQWNLCSWSWSWTCNLVVVLVITKIAKLGKIVHVGESCHLPNLSGRGRRFLVSTSAHEHQTSKHYSTKATGVCLQNATSSIVGLLYWQKHSFYPERSSP